MVKKDDELVAWVDEKDLESFKNIHKLSPRTEREMKFLWSGKWNGLLK